MWTSGTFAAPAAQQKLKPQCQRRAALTGERLFSARFIIFMACRLFGRTPAAQQKLKPQWQRRAALTGERLFSARSTIFMACRLFDRTPAAQQKLRPQRQRRAALTGGWLLIVKSPFLWIVGLWYCAAKAEAPEASSPDRGVAIVCQITLFMACRLMVLRSKS